jgi:hypothetical protein
VGLFPQASTRRRKVGARMQAFLKQAFVSPFAGGKRQNRTNGPRPHPVLLLYGPTTATSTKRAQATQLKGNMYKYTMTRTATTTLLNRQTTVKRRKFGAQRRNHRGHSHQSPRFCLNFPPGILQIDIIIQKGQKVCGAIAKASRERAAYYARPWYKECSTDESSAS